MHRQSLSSPNNLNLHTKSHEPLGPTESDAPEIHNQATSLAGGGDDIDDDEEFRKSQKPQKSNENLIHLIPILIVFSFLILYLSSHDPSPKDLTHFNDFEKIFKPMAIEDQNIASEADNAGKSLMMEKRYVSEISSVKKLENELDSQNQPSRIHRKIGDF